MDFLGGGEADWRLLRSLPFFHKLERPHRLDLPTTLETEVRLLFQSLESETDSASEALLVRHSLVRVHLIKLHRLFPQFWAGKPLNAAQRLTALYCELVEDRFLDLRRVSDDAPLLSVAAGQLIHNQLILEAKRLSAGTSLTVNEIAYRLKVPDPSYFGRFFRRSAGMSPLQFRGGAHERE